MYPRTPARTKVVPLWITVLALPSLMPPVFLHPELELMWEGWLAGSQQLVITPNTQREVGGKTAGGCISVAGNSSSALRIKAEEAATLMSLGKQLLQTSRAAQRLSRLCASRGKKLHQPNVIGPQRKGSAVGKAVGSGLRTGCQETLRGQGGERAASSLQDAAQRFPRKFTEQKMIAGRKNI